MAKFLAHISDDKSREQSVQEHLKNTALLAGQFADKFCCRDWGFGCGMLHDIGKYSEEFQVFSGILTVFFQKSLDYFVISVGIDNLRGIS